MHPHLLLYAMFILGLTSVTTQAQQPEWTVHKPGLQWDFYPLEEAEDVVRNEAFLYYERDGYLVQEQMQGPPTKYTNHIAVGPDSMLVISSSHGLSQLQDGKWTLLSRQYDLPSKRVYGLEVDAQGTIYIGYDRAGLVRLENGKLSHFTSENSALPHDEVQAILHTEEHGLFVGTQKGISLLKDGQWTHFNAANSVLSPVTENQVVWPPLEITIGPDAKVHTRYWNKIAVYEQGSWQELPNKPEVAEIPHHYNFVSAYNYGHFNEDKTKLYINNKGVWTERDVSLMHKLDRFHDIEFFNPTDFVIISSNDIFYFKGDESVKFSWKDIGLPGNADFTRASLSKENELLLGNRHGLAKFDGQDWEVIMPEHKPLPSYQVFAGMEYMPGEIYLATYQGLVMWKPGELSSKFDYGALQENKSSTIFHRSQARTPEGTIYGINFYESYIIDGDSAKVFESTHPEINKHKCTMYCVAYKPQTAQILIGTSRGLLVREKAKQDQLYTPKSKASAITDIGVTDSGTAYLVSTAALLSFDGKELQTELQDHYYRDICVYGNEVYAGTDKGLMKKQGQEWITLPTYLSEEEAANPHLHKAVHHVLKSSAEKLYLFSLRPKLYISDDEKNYEEIDMTMFSNFSKVFFIEQFSDKKIYIGTNAGLIVYNGEVE